MGNKKLEFLLWKKYPKNKPSKTGLYFVEWESDGDIFFNYDHWEKECPKGDKRNESFYWLTLEYQNVIAFSKVPKGIKCNI